MSTFKHLRQRFVRFLGAALLPPLLLAPAVSSAVIVHTPPTATFANETFQPMQFRWQPMTGRWTVEGGVYVSRAAGDGLSLLAEYAGFDVTDQPASTLHAEKFTVRARMINQGALDDHRVGIVYNYQDAANFYEALVSATGIVSVHQIVNGIETELAREQTAVGRNTWFDLEVLRAGSETRLKLNGVTSSIRLTQPEFTASGQIGLVARGAAAKFDNVFVGVPFLDQPFRENFADGVADGWQPVSGAWGISDGTYINSANPVQHTNITLAPIEADIGRVLEFTLHVRMFNPYGASGNQVGIVFNYIDPDDYQEVVFSPTGVANVNHVVRGVARNLATAAYRGSAGRWFDVKLEMSVGCCGENRGITVAVDRGNVFENVDVNPNGLPEGKVGLITHWAPGQFRDVWFDYGVFEPLSERFSAGMPPTTVPAVGTWDASGGVLRNSPIEQTNLVVMPCCRSTDLIYKARLSNDFGSSGNLVGLIYDYQPLGTPNSGDYYEVVFSPRTATARGKVSMRKVIRGVTYTQAVGDHDIPPRAWFEVGVLRRGETTIIAVNDRAVLTAKQGSLHPDDFDGRRPTSVGVVTHWSNGRFDDLSVTESMGR